MQHQHKIKWLCIKIKEYNKVWENSYIIKEINYMAEYNKIDK